MTFRLPLAFEDSLISELLVIRAQLRDTRDFPAEALKPLGTEVQYPDELIPNLFNLTPDSRSARHGFMMRASKLAENAEEYLGLLEREGLAETVCILRTAHRQGGSKVPTEEA
jgi:hypothetical protein